LAKDVDTKKSPIYKGLGRDNSKEKLILKSSKQTSESQIETINEHNSVKAPTQQSLTVNEI